MHLSELGNLGFQLMITFHLHFMHLIKCQINTITDAVTQMKDSLYYSQGTLFF